MIKTVAAPWLKWAFTEFPNASESALRGIAFGRSAIYLSESLPLLFFDRLLRKSKDESLTKPPPEYRKAVLESVQQLIDQDIQNIIQGRYGPEVLWPEQTPWAHAESFFKVIRDGLKLGDKKAAKDPHRFSADAQALLEDLPEYYHRNFHYQTDGYLSEESADLYDHQVEILFRGVSHAMRRLLLSPMLKALPGKNIKILDVGCGTGSSTRFLAQVFPDAKITAFDLSFPYLKKAQSRLPKFGKRIEYVQGAAEDMPFRDSHFDAVVSTFMFHELPLDVRKQSLREMRRVVKENGFVGVIDSIQKNDNPDLAWGLNAFPRDFHEPFYKNYLLNPMETLMQEAGLAKPQVHVGFLSKGLSSRKSPISN